ncbi:MAG: cytochrome C oxidase subunit IV family protein [Dehalococcoidia bacterium]
MSTQETHQRERSRHAGGGPAAIRTGWVVFIALAVLTVVEYIIAVEVSRNLPVIVAIAVVKSLFILYYFMHVVRAWLSDGEGH